MRNVLSETDLNATWSKSVAYAEGVLEAAKQGNLQNMTLWMSDLESLAKVLRSNLVAQVLNQAE